VPSLVANAPISSIVANAQLPVRCRVQVLRHAIPTPEAIPASRRNTRTLSVPARYVMSSEESAERCSIQSLADLSLTLRSFGDPLEVEGD